MSAVLTITAIAQWRPGVPIALVVALSVVAVAAAAWAYQRRAAVPRWRRAVLIAARLTLVAALVAVLLGPVRLKADRAADDHDDDALVVAIDTSRSMGMDDVDGKPRLDAVVAAIDRYRRTPGAPAIEVVGFDRAGPTRAKLDALLAAGDGTAMFDAIDQLIAGFARPGGRLLVASDGRDTVVPARERAERLARLTNLAMARGVTVHALPVGGDAGAANRSVFAFAQPAVAFEGEPVRIRAVIRTPVTGEPLTVTLRREGEAVQTLRLGPAGDAVRDVVLTDQPTGAATDVRYGVEVSALADERRVDDNRATLYVPRVGRRLRVLVIDGSPHWQTRTLVGAIKLDRRLAVTTWQAYSPTRTAVAHYGPDDAAQPTLTSPPTAEQLAAFDAIVLGQHIERLIPVEQAGLLIDFVRNGGGLMLARGRPYADATPLEAMLPGDWAQRSIGALRLAATEAGMSRLALPAGVELTRLPALSAAVTADRLRGAAVVLLEGLPADAPADLQTEREAAVAYQRVGDGRVMVVYTSGLWRWAMLPRRLAEQRAVHGDLTRRLVSTVALGESLSPRAEAGFDMPDRAARVGEAFEVAVAAQFTAADRLLAEGAAVTVTDPAGVEHRVALAADASLRQRLVGRFTPSVPGEHVATLVVPSVVDEPQRARFRAAAASTEMSDLTADHAPLIALASATGGRVLDTASLAGLAEAAAPTDAAGAAATFEPAWARLWVFALLMGAAGVEWFARRTGGLA